MAVTDFVRVVETEYATRNNLRTGTGAARPGAARRGGGVPPYRPLNSGLRRSEKALMPSM